MSQHVAAHVPEPGRFRDYPRFRKSRDDESFFDYQRDKSRHLVETGQAFSSREHCPVCDTETTHDHVVMFDDRIMSICQRCHNPNATVWPHRNVPPGHTAATYGTDLIARGLHVYVGIDSHAEMVPTLLSGRATAQDILRLLGPQAGVWWGIMSTFGDLADFEDYAWSDDLLADTYEDLDGGEVSIVLVAKRPKRGKEDWDPEVHNPLEVGGLMGNSYLQSGEQVELIEIRYNAGHGWKSIPARGIQVRASQRAEIEIIGPDWIGDYEVIARIGGEIVGRLKGGEFNAVERIFVDPAHRRKGIATQMFQALQKHDPSLKRMPDEFSESGAAWFSQANPGGREYYSTWSSEPDWSGWMRTGSLGDRLWWRVHPDHRGDLMPEMATSAPFFGDGGTYTGPKSSGYSAFDNPWHLWLYIWLRWGWEGQRDSGTPVLGFSGTRVGTGHDGEDLVMPTPGGTVQTFTVDQFFRELVRTPFPQSPIFARWVAGAWPGAPSWLGLALRLRWLDQGDPVHEHIVRTFAPSKVASAIQHQQGTPLNYRGKFPGSPQRLYITEPGYEGKHTTGNWEGTPPDVVAYLDYAVTGDTATIWFLHTREDREGNGLASRLVADLYRRHSGLVDWDELVSKGAEILYKRFLAQYPDRTRGWVYGRWYTGPPPRTAGAAGGLPEDLQWQGPQQFGPYMGINVRQPGLEGFAGRLRWVPEEGSVIIDVSVHPDLRRRGLATEMLRRARQFDPKVHHSLTLSEEGEAWARAVASKTATRLGLVGETYMGERGNKSHITRNEKGYVPVSALQFMLGASGEKPGQHRNKQGQEWDDFVADIKARGILKPIFITVDPGEGPRISEGNHRRDAALEAGLREAPVNIRYFGKAEDESLVAPQVPRDIRPPGAAMWDGTVASKTAAPQKIYRGVMFGEPTVVGRGDAKPPTDAELLRWLKQEGNHRGTLFGRGWTTSREIAEQFAVGAANTFSVWAFREPVEPVWGLVLEADITREQDEASHPFIWTGEDEVAPPPADRIKSITAHVMKMDPEGLRYLPAKVIQVRSFEVPKSRWSKTALPSWRDRGAMPERAEAIIAPDLGRARRNSYLVYLYGQPHARRDTLAEAKGVVEEIYGDLEWTRVPGDPDPHPDRIWGDTTMFNDAPWYEVVERLPRLGVTAGRSLQKTAIDDEYANESDWFYSLGPDHDLTKPRNINTLLRLAEQVAKDDGLDCDIVIIRGAPGVSRCDYDYYTETLRITIASDMRDKWTLLHEMAHALPLARGNDEIGLYHDGFFDRIFTELLQRYGGVSVRFGQPPPKTAGAKGDLPEGVVFEEEWGLPNLLPGERVVSATLNGRRIGWLVWQGEGDGRINVIVVEPEWRRRGIATRLFEEAKKRDPGVRHDPNESNIRPDGREWIKSMATAATLDSWRPTGGMFGRGADTLDPRVFGLDTEQMRVDIRDSVLGALDAYWTPLYGDWRAWAKVYLAGSGASYWWDSDADMDILIGVDLDALRQARPANKEIADADILGTLNRGLRNDLRPTTTTLNGFETTWFVNGDSYDIRKIHPYAAYDLTTDSWVVKPPVLPANWGPDSIPEETWRRCEMAAREAQQVLSLPEPERSVAGTVYFDWVHEGRRAAYSAYGGGWLDPGNVIYQYLSQHPDRLLRRLYLCKHPDQATDADAIEVTAAHVGNLADPRVQEAVNEFLARPNLPGLTPWDAHDQCYYESQRFLEVLAKHGVTGEIVMGYQREQFQGHEVITQGHVGVRVGDSVYDWTARQFDDKAPVPKIVSIRDWETQWPKLAKTALVPTYEAAVTGASNGGVTT